MTRGPLRGATWTLAAGVVLVVGLVLASMLIVPDAPRPMALPSAGELVELKRYLDPTALEVPANAGVPPVVEVGGSPFGEMGSGRVAGRGSGSGDPGRGGGVGLGSGGTTGSSASAGVDGGEASAGVGARWRLSAILVAGGRRLAILNDRTVRPGDRLEDGTRVDVVEDDHVVIITPEGARRRLELERQER